MRFDNRHLFSGKINGKTLNEFKQFDYKETSLEERLKLVNEKIDLSKDENGLSFFDNYICSHYKNNLNGRDELAENHEVFKTLENMANYLLGSTEIRELRKKEEQQYKFYVDESEFRLRTKKEQLFENVANDNEMSSENIIHFLLSNKSENHVIVSNISVNQSDINEDSYCGRVLKDYYAFLKYLDAQLKNPNEENKGKRYILTKNKNEVTQDMVLTKTALKGIIKFKHAYKSSAIIDWDCFDWRNHSHIKEALYVKRSFHPDNDLSFILLDMDNLVKEMCENKKLTKPEIKIYKLIKQGLKNNEIAEILKVRRTYISNTVAVIVKKISNYAVYKNWHKEQN